MAEKILPKAQVVRREDLTSDLMKMWLQPPPEFQPFKPGQYCTIGVDGIERPYSIVSSPHEQFIELFLELVPNTYRTPKSLTPKLWELHEGDWVTLRPKAKGTFLLDESAVCHGMVATVTGIAPFVSMLRALQAGYYHEVNSGSDFGIYIFQGASYYDEFGYDEELIRLDRMYENVFYVPTVSRPTEERNKPWDGITGRINAHFALIAKHIPKENGMVYLCGNEGMVDDLGNTKITPDKPLGKFIQAGYKVKQEVFF